MNARPLVWMGLGGFVALSFSGCLGFEKGPTIYLGYSLVNLAGDDREASLGPHCGYARIHDGVAEVESRSYERLGRARPFLIVEFDRTSHPPGGSFRSQGNEGYPTAFPALLDPRINGTSSVIASLDYQEGHVVVDSQSVSLPHAWTRTEKDDWRAEFRLSQGPDTVRTFETGACM